MRLLILQDLIRILMRTLNTSMTPQIYTSGKMISKMIRDTTKNTIIPMNTTVLIYICYKIITTIVGNVVEIVFKKKEYNPA